MHRNLKFLDKGADAIFICDKKTACISDANWRACELFGCSIEELKERDLESFSTVSVPGAQKQFLSLINDARIEGSMFEWHVRAKSGRVFWLEMSVQCVGLQDVEQVMLIGRDVTQRKLEISAEQSRIERVNRKMAAFAEYNPNPVFEFSAAGELRYFNKAAEELAHSVAKKSPLEILPPETREVVSECWVTKRSKLRLITQLQDRTVSWSFFPIATIGRVHCYAGDITDKLALENQLRQSQKLEAIGQLAAGVAHDFNNILTIIQGNASMFLTEKGISHEATECADQIIKAADRAASLTRQLLVFSRKQVLHRVNLNLNEIVRDMAKMLQPLLGEHISLRSELSPTLPCIYADPGMIEQIVLNMAVNSRDAMPKGGKLVISTHSEIVEKEHSGLFVCLSVADSGCGITQGNITHIFEPFFTTKEIGKGTGLGLATVYGIVHQHEGWIEVSSELGKGTLFKIYLPTVETNAETKSHPTRQWLPCGTETILIVEDEASLREVVSGVLQRCGYGILMAGSGTAALDVWRENKDKVDLLFTDMVMPDGLTGQELVNRLTSEKPGLKVIYTSGYSPELFGGAEMRQDSVFLQKPYHAQRLAQVVRTCLDGK
jgi:two-component system, cell cycle sensor histidine kinase and response regulator CckA